jgi:folate-binding protein YgfZ
MDSRATNSAETNSSQAVAETPLAEQHRAAGAALAEFAGCLLPDKFSGEREEYRAARENVALFDTNWHAIFSLSGRDAVRYLHAVTSNNVKELAENYGIPALLLNPQGHILAELEIYRLKDKLLVLSHAAFRARTFATLKKYILGSQVQLDDLSNDLGSVALEGPRATTVVAEAAGLALTGFSEFATAEVEIDAVPCHLIRRSHFGGVGAEIIAPRQHLPLLWTHLAASIHSQHGLPIGMKALNALRLEAGIPWFPLDFNDTVIPHEAAVEGTHISFNKGCYTGQEIVERVRSRGQVNRKRVTLKFSTPDPPAPGTKLRAGDNDVGYITSSAFSPASNTAIGMGYLRREHNTVGSIVEFDGGTAEVVGGKTTATSD